MTYAVAWTTGTDARGPQSKAKHIIMFLGDGMQLEHEIATSRYLFGKDNGLAFHHLAYKGYVATWDVTTYNKYAASLGLPPYNPVGFNPLVGYDPIKGGRRPYPLQSSGIDVNYFLSKISAKIPAADSASTATALSTGFKTDDGNIAWLPGDPADGALKTIAEILRDKKGFSIGVVSTVPFTHATPAAFVSHNENRNNCGAIGTEIIRSFQPEVVIGGGYPGPGGTPTYQYLSKADHDYLKLDPASPYVFVERTASSDGSVKLLEAARQAVAQDKKLFGLFGGPGGNFESPVPSDLPGTPSISRATIENPLLKDATLAALQVLSRDPDGFFVMIEQGDIDWANHANDFQRMVGTIWDLHEAVAAAVDFVNKPGDDIDWSNTLLIVTSDHANSYMRLNDSLKLGAGDLPQQDGTCPACTYPQGQVTYSTTDHSNELVTLYVQGNFRIPDFYRYEGKWYPRTRIIDNTHLFHAIASAAGVETISQLRPKSPKITLNNS
jgi:alkaline phosphatase